MAYRARSLCCAALLLSGLINAARGEEIVLQPAQMQALGIKTLVPQGGVAGRLSGLAGRVTVPNGQMRVVSAPVAGMIESLEVAPGLPVKKGQVVARLASKDALELQRQAIESASQATLAEQSLKRDEQLFKEGLIAESRLQATRANAAQSAALASEMRQGLALAGAAAGKVGGPLALTAPMDGVVLEQGAQVGQRVDAATLIYRIAKLSPLWLEAQVPVAAAASLKVGQAVEVTGSAAKGKLLAVGKAVEAGSQSVLLRAEVTQGADALRPGQMVELAIDGVAASPQGPGTRIPASALFRHHSHTYGDQTVVFVQTGHDDKGSRFRPILVDVLLQSGDSAQVRGLPEGAAIVSKGVSGLKAMWTGVGRGE